MNTLMSSYVGIGLIAIIVILIILAIIRKAIKLFFFIIILILGFSAYNIFVKHVSPLDLFNTYKTNITYCKDVADYSIKVTDSASKIKDIVASSNIDSNSIKVLQTETENLNRYLSEIQVLKHSDSLNSFHDNYCNNLKSIVDVSSSAAGFAKSDNLAEMKKLLDDFNSKVNQLTKLSSNI